MKKIVTLLVLCIIVLAGIANANVYASGIRISNSTVTDYNAAGNSFDGILNDGSGVKIWFIINEAGIGSLSATVTIKQGASTIKTLTVSSPAKGVNSVVWDGSQTDLSPAPTGSYTFEVTVSDPTGHSTFDSVWVAGAHISTTTDIEGLTSFAYRGNATITYQADSAFGRVYVSRGTTTANGFYELRSDGSYLRKIATTPAWVASVPTDLFAFRGYIVGLQGYGFTNGNSMKRYDAGSNTFMDSANFSSTGTRGVYVRIEGSDTVYYTAKGGTANQNYIVKKVGALGVVTNVIQIDPYLTTPGTNTGYLKGLSIDDDGNYYIIFGDASASRKRIAKFNSAGTNQWVKALDADFTKAATAIFQAITITRGSNSGSASDDKIYVLVQSPTATENGIYSVASDGSGITQLLVNPVGVTNAATSQIINSDAAGNVVWSNGASTERIIQFSPADGPNSYTTVSPTGYSIVVTTALPVELTSFSAVTKGKSVELKWNTATETNNHGFEVEKNIAGSWNNIGFVEGHGTINAPQSYKFVDGSASGTVQYRLKQIDRNGTFTYSNVIEIAVAAAVNSYELGQNFPNPFNPTTTIRFSVKQLEHASVKVFDITGREIATLFNDVASPGQTYNVQFNAAGLASGMYFYVLQTPNAREVKKMSLLK